MHILRRTYEFAAAHSINSLPPDHKCYGMHGHNYRLVIEVAGKVEPHGMVIDFHAIDAVWEAIFKPVLDHKTINDLDGIGPATAENLAAWVYERAAVAIPGKARLRAIEVYENERSSVRYEGRPT